ncbi:MAG: 30S ribosomal protein S5 [bacterium]
MQFERKDEADQLREKLIHVNRVAKVVKGGRRFSFGALVVVGDGNGQVGLGYGKANEVSEAIRKAVQDGKNRLFKVPMSGTTIPHELIAREGAAKVVLRPASPGTGIIAGGAVRAIVERAGIKDILTKNLGTKNQINAAKATIKGLKSLKTREDAAALKKRLRELPERTEVEEKRKERAPQAAIDKEPPGTEEKYGIENAAD